MIRRKPTKIEVKSEDKDELEELVRLRSQNPNPNPNPLQNPNPKPANLLLDRLEPLDPASKSHRIGL